MKQLETIEKAALIFALIVVASAVLKVNSEWKQVVSKEGAFTVLMPAQPKLEDEPLTVNGVTVESHSLRVSSREGDGCEGGSNRGGSRENVRVAAQEPDSRRRESNAFIGDDSHKRPPRQVLQGQDRG